MLPKTVRKRGKQEYRYVFAHLLKNKPREDKPKTNEIGFPRDLGGYSVERMKGLGMEEEGWREGCVSESTLVFHMIRNKYIKSVRMGREKTQVKYK